MMKNFNPSKNLALYQATDSSLSHEELLELISRETRQKYPHLNVRFYPDNYMQAIVRIKTTTQSLLKKTPQSFIDILCAANFHPEHFSHRLLQNEEQQEEQLDAQQFVMNNNELVKIGYRFVMKASFGPTFVSFWFRNLSDNPRIDLPVFYALEILNKLHQQFNEIDNSEARPESNPATESNPAIKKATGS